MALALPLDAAGRAALEGFRAFCTGDARVLVRRPGLLLQQAANAPADATEVLAGARGRAHRSDWIEWRNKPAHRSACVGTFGGLGALCWAAAWAPCGDLCALGGSDRRVHVVDVRSGEEVEALAGHTDDVTYVSFCPASGTSLVSAADGDPLLVWSFPADGRASLERRVPLGADCVALAWGAGGQFAACAADGSVQLLDTARGWGVAGRWELEGALRGAAWAADARSVAVGAGAAVVVVDTLDAGAPPRRLEGHGARVTCVGWHLADSTILASADLDGVARVWDVAAGAALRSVCHPETVHDVQLLGEARLLTASADGAVRLWPPTGDAPAATLRAHTADARCARVSPGGRWVLSSGDDGAARLWELARASQEAPPPGSSAAVQSCAWCERLGAGLAIAVADGDGVVQCFGAGGRAPLWRVQLEPLSPSCTAVASVSAATVGGEPLVACAMWRCVRLLAAADGREVGRRARRLVQLVLARRDGRRRRAARRWRRRRLRCRPARVAGRRVGRRDGVWRHEGRRAEHGALARRRRLLGEHERGGRAYVERRAARGAAPLLRAERRPPGRRRALADARRVGRRARWRQLRRGGARRQRRHRRVARRRRSAGGARAAVRRHAARVVRRRARRRLARDDGRRRARPRVELARAAGDGVLPRDRRLRQPRRRGRGGGVAPRRRRRAGGRGWRREWAAVRAKRAGGRGPTTLDHTCTAERRFVPFRPTVWPGLAKPIRGSIPTV